MRMTLQNMIILTDVSRITYFMIIFKRNALILSLPLCNQMHIYVKFGV